MARRHCLFVICLTFFACLLQNAAYAANTDSGIGQTIRINTQLSGYRGKPSWLLVIRDVDHGQNIPYIFDFNKLDNFWIAFSYGRNYLITASTLQFSPYQSMPYYSQRKIRNFCQLESNGRIIHGDSFNIMITGKLTPYSDTYQCDVMRFNDRGYQVIQP